jgi:hypothetical protein
MVDRKLMAENARRGKAAAPKPNFKKLVLRRRLCGELPTAVCGSAARPRDVRVTS